MMKLWVVTSSLVAVALMAQGIVESTPPANAPPLRLVGGSQQSEGRVEIFLNNSWGTICDDFFTGYEGAVICRQLGYTGILRVEKRAHFGEGNGSILLDDVYCEGNETSILQCYHDRDHNCRHSEDVGVVCNTYDPGEEGAVQLVGGSEPSEGRVEIFHNGEWGTVCNWNWDSVDAAVVCKQLGYLGALSTPPGGTYGSGSGLVWLYDVQCVGSEDQLSGCDHYKWGEYMCAHTYDANVLCSPDTPTDETTAITVSTKTSPSPTTAPPTSHPTTSEQESAHNQTTAPDSTSTTVGKLSSSTLIIIATSVPFGFALIIIAAVVAVVITVFIGLLYSRRRSADVEKRSGVLSIKVQIYTNKGVIDHEHSL